MSKVLTLKKVMLRKKGTHTGSCIIIKEITFVQIEEKGARE